MIPLSTATKQTSTSVHERGKMFCGSVWWKHLLSPISLTIVDPHKARAILCRLTYEYLADGRLIITLTTEELVRANFPDCNQVDVWGSCCNDDGCILRWSAYMATGAYKIPYTTDSSIRMLR